MKKSLIIAAAMSAMALSAGTASSAPMAGQLSGVKAAASSEVQQVHYRPYKHYHKRKWHRRNWNKHRRWSKRHCFIRVGKRVCVWR